MRLCILETDINDGPGLEVHGTMPEQFEAWLAPALPEAQWDAVAVHAGAPLPEPRAYDAYLVTGSRYGVYDDLPWIAPLAEFLRELRKEDRPVGGICFGHQIIAHAYGGQVIKSPEGWILGAQDYAGKAAFAFHQDQVVRLPEDVRDCVAAPRCAVARLTYAFPAFSVQYHPEFTSGFMSALLDTYTDGIAPSTVAQARATLGDALHTDAIAHDFAQFFRQHST